MWMHRNGSQPPVHRTLYTVDSSENEANKKHRQENEKKVSLIKSKYTQKQASNTNGTKKKKIRADASQKSATDRHKNEAIEY